MIMKGVKGLITTIRLENVTLNIGVIGLNFAGSSSKASKEFYV